MSTDQPFEPAPPTPPAAPVAGWYPDPADAAMQRYWDGAAWTSTTHPLVTAPPAWQSTTAPAAALRAPLYGTAGYAAPAYPAQGYGAAGYAAPPGYGVQPRKVGFGDAVRRAFAGWKDYSGRATVAEYWWFYLFQMVVFLVPYVILLVLFAVAIPPSTGSTGSSTSTAEPNGALVAVLVVFTILFVLLAIVLFLVHLALTIRRLHDTDREGWWYLISFVPFGGVVLLVFTVMAGTPGPNRYGPVPT